MPGEHSKANLAKQTASLSFTGTIVISNRPYIIIRLIPNPLSLVSGRFWYETNIIISLQRRIQLHLKTR